MEKKEINRIIRKLKDDKVMDEKKWKKWMERRVRCEDMIEKK